MNPAHLPDIEQSLEFYPNPMAAVAEIFQPVPPRMEIGHVAGAGERHQHRLGRHGRQRIGNLHNRQVAMRGEDRGQRRLLVGTRYMLSGRGT